MNDRKHLVLVYGPAYLDIVMRVGQPLVRSGHAPLDKSVDGIFCKNGKHQNELEIQDPSGNLLILSGLNSMKHPTGRLELSHSVLDSRAMSVAVIEVVEELGGMGAGYAAVLGGRLVSALGSNHDLPRTMIESGLKRLGIEYSPVIIEGKPTDWTLIVSSGPHGDKLPVGSRGCHSELSASVMHQHGNWELVVAASLKNELLFGVLESHPESLRVLVPAMRNCRDQQFPLRNLVGLADFISLNEHEWQELTPLDRSAWWESKAILCVTRGPDGADIYWTDRSGIRQNFYQPVFPRSVPVVDTNRAGEAFASFLIQSLMAQGWSKTEMNITSEMVQRASLAGSAAAGLTIQLPNFGFPSAQEVARVLHKGVIS